jgi:hypothetical protein
VDSSYEHGGPVDPNLFSPATVHTENGMSIENSAMFPHVHNAYVLRKVFYRS